MNQKKKKQAAYWLKVAVIGIALGIALQFVRAAWTPPSDTPPEGNVEAPINTGVQKQTKLGDICTTVTGTEKCLSTAGGTTTPTCGNGTCETGETTASCPGDCPAPHPVCNNNGVCESGENLSNCSADCCQCGYLGGASTTHCGQTVWVTTGSCCFGASYDKYLCTYPGNWVRVEQVECGAC